MSSNTQIKTFFDQQTFTYTHVIYDSKAKEAAIIDSVLDYDPKSGRTNTVAADQVVDFIQKSDLAVKWILETHVHADHLSAAPYLKDKLGGQIGIGSKINVVQGVFKDVFNAESGFKSDGSQFDKVFDDEETFKIGELNVKVLHTPGHTPACVSYIVENEHAFIGDTLFMPDAGTARCDFPGGDATVLFQSVKRLLSLEESTKLYMCHDYGPNGRDYKYITTVKEQREQNIHVKDSIALDDFVQMRTERDATLDMPVLILPSVQVNMRAGQLPPAEGNGKQYLKIPLNVL
ncbi:MBL fold metallo-hydrolase [Reinekea sp.]|jgi:glyoxylase-like metal-dependent hydrolase (beta-lactamase superfamily II)|uniref:MBL fold metallo-hydrolase n=2 Tax=Reinekea sp. TaxID=1970455 RepID=UPI00398A07D2